MNMAFKVVLREPTQDDLLGGWILRLTVRMILEDIVPLQVLCVDFETKLGISTEIVQTSEAGMRRKNLFQYVVEQAL
ncbi:hypothetical protein Aduo_016173 [Ancylostoma duodenale]